MTYVFTKTMTEYPATLPGVYSDINVQENYLVQNIRELIAVINGANTGNDIDGNALQNYTGVGLNDRLASLEAGSGIKNVTSIDTAFSVVAAGDRFIKLFNGSGTVWNGIQYSNSSGLFLFTNNTSTLQKIRHADGVGNTDGATVGQINTLFVTNAQPIVRQCVLSGSVDASYNKNALTIGTGLNVNLAATATNMVLTAGNGFSAHGDSHKMGTIAADTTITMVNTTTNYLYCDLSGANPVLGATTNPWSDAEVWNGQGLGALLNFDGLAGTAWTDVYGNAWNATIQAGTGALSTSSPIHGTTSWVTVFTSGNISYIDTTAVTLSTSSPWTMEFYVNFSAFAAADIPIISSQAAQVFSISTTSASKKLIMTINDGSSLATTGTTVLNAATLYHIAVTWNGIDTYKLWLNGALEMTVTKNQLTTTGFGIRIGSYVALTSAKYTQMTFDDFRLTYNQMLYTGAFTPAITTLPAVDSFYWFNRKRNIMQYGITGSWADKPTVFIGEADAAGGVVTAVREYARMGVADSGWVPYTNTALQTFTHYMGTSNYEVETLLQNQVAEGGYTFQQIASAPMCWNGTTMLYPTYLKYPSKATLFIGTNLQLMNAGSNAAVALTPANWLIRYKARRNY